MINLFKDEFSSAQLSFERFGLLSCRLRQTCSFMIDLFKDEFFYHAMFCSPFHRHRCRLSALVGVLVVCCKHSRFRSPLSQSKRTSNAKSRKNMHRKGAYTHDNVFTNDVVSCEKLSFVNIYA